MYKLNDMSFLPKAMCRTWERERERERGGYRPRERVSFCHGPYWAGSWATGLGWFMGHGPMARERRPIYKGEGERLKKGSKNRNQTDYSSTALLPPPICSSSSGCSSPNPSSLIPSPQMLFSSPSLQFLSSCIQTTCFLS